MWFRHIKDLKEPESIVLITGLEHYIIYSYPTQKEAENRFEMDQFVDLWLAEPVIKLVKIDAKTIAKIRKKEADKGMSYVD